ncbi:sensor histidine kinase [Kushneria indalinina]|uniref:histidine kinase n=1 Tax=Kushneria indalinina DSM 14324 TaxID=1122140 RepID=A0A3D9DU87_9GAMM|nr:HAMP domain-containing sensor histidine kinase [Kushneria indalinina]REC94338.1 signal transduction histidine kinase [Kushneria indalinina DSM 14324]
MRLRTTILLTIICPLLLTLVGFSAVALWVLEDNMQQRQQEEVRLIAHGIRLPLTQALAHQDAQALQEGLSTTFSLSRLYGAFILSPSGQQMAGVGLAGGLQDDALLQKAISTAREAGGYSQQGGQNFYTYLLPMTDAQGAVLGVLQINRLATGIERYMSLMTTVALLLAALVGVLVVLMVWWGFRRYVDRPVNRLYRSMKAVQGGNRLHRMTPGGAREFRELGEAFNAMLDAVAHKEQEVREQQQQQLALERSLKKSRRLAEIGVLAAGVAHELGSPLTVIDGQVQRLQRRDDLPDDARQRLTRIRHETRRMEDTVRQLLDMGRRHTLHPGQHSLGHMIIEAERLARDALHFEPTHPRLVTHLPIQDVITVDRQRFQQLLDNLVKNAFQAGSQQVTLSADYSAKGVTLRIEDDGPGINADHRGQIFDPFYTTRGAGKGSGLGLTIVHRVVEDHGGHITLEESALGGAAFVITLPPETLLPPEATANADTTPDSEGETFPGNGEEAMPRNPDHD